MEEYLTHAEALEFIAMCERAGVRILGLDVMRRDGDTVTPVTSADWGEIAPEETWRLSADLLQDEIPDGGNAVIFVTDEPS